MTSNEITLIGTGDIGPVHGAATGIPLEDTQVWSATR